jgi:integrase
VYSPADVDTALARVFGAGVRPLHIEEAVFEAMLDGWRAQQTARYLKPKTIQHNERGVRAFVGHVGRFPWEWRASDVDEYFEDLLSRPQRLARSTLRAYQWRLKGFSEYVCDRRYPWTVICEREFGRAPGQLFDERNLVSHLDEFEGDPRRRPLTVDELDAFFAACDERVTRASASSRKGTLPAWRDQAMFKIAFGWGLRRRELAMLDVCDFRPDARLPEFGAFAQVHAPRARTPLAPRPTGAALGALRGRAAGQAPEQPRPRLLRAGGGAARRQPRVPRRRSQAAQAQLPHAARTRRRGPASALNQLTCARSPPSHRCAAAGSPHAAAATLTWPAQKDRAAATLPPAGSPHQPSRHRPAARPDRGPR